MKLFKNITKFLFSSNAALIAIPLLMIVPNICLCITEDMTPMAICANLLIPSGIYILILSAFKRTNIGALCLIPIMILCAFQIVLLFLYHGSIIAIDMFMNVVTTNPAEVSELLNSLTDAMATVILMYLPIIIWAIYRLFRQQAASQRMLHICRTAGLTILLAGTLTACACYASSPSYRITRQLFPVNVCHNMISTVERMDKIAKYHQTSAGFTYGASSTHPKDQKEIYVMVIGETSRADNFGMAGYQRNTTPVLQQLDNVMLYGKTLSESNTTHKSVPMLLSTLTAENFDSIYFWKSTITAFKEAGYHTAYFSAQKRNHSFIDFFGEEAHDTDFMPDHNDTVCKNDMALIDRVKSFIEASSDKNKRFIVLRTYGSHIRDAD